MKWINKIILLTIIGVITTLPSRAIEDKTIELSFAGVKLVELDYAGDLEREKCWFDRFIPLGFSENGLFAYLQKRYDDQKTAWKLIIVNLLTDKTVYTEWIDQDNREHLISLYLEKNKSKILWVLKKYSINLAGKSLPYYRLPVNINGDQYQIEMINDSTTSSPQKGYQAHALLMRSQNNGGKIIANVETLRDFPPLAANLLVSPFEKRAAVIIAVPHHRKDSELYYHFKISGAHLVNGFK